MKLSIVLITKDQAWNVDRLIGSVLREAPEAETVLVDSLSTDDTVERAAKYDVRILRLKPGWDLTPPAGRYVGFHGTDGDAVLFLDGDMELCPGWLARALELLVAEPEIAAVTGRIVDTLPAEAGRPVTITDDHCVVAEERHTFGAGLYRRSVLDEVGPFNPYFRAEEEPELGLRIRRAGYRIVSRGVVARHFLASEENFALIWRRRRRNLYLGQGQVIRYHLGDGLLWPFLKERRHPWEPALVLAAGAACAVLSAAQMRWIWVGAWAGVVGSAVAADAARKRSVRRAGLSLAKRLVILEGALRGLALEPRDPSGYPLDPDVLK
jgi:glycosyltransferase involved in cell wall biosynthesis